MKQDKIKLAFLIVGIVLLLAILGVAIYFAVTLPWKVQRVDAPSNAVTDGMAATFTGAEDTKELYINTDKTVYAELADELNGSDSEGFMLIFTDIKITEETTETETGEAIVMIARFIKGDNGYQLLFESIIKGFGKEQDVIVYDVASDSFCTDTSIVIGEDGKLTFSEDLENAPNTLYCYMPKTCGCDEADIIPASFIERIFSTAPFIKEVQA